jgi:hypothetical protein
MSFGKKVRLHPVGAARPAALNRRGARCRLTLLFPIATWGLLAWGLSGSMEGFWAVVAALYFLTFLAPVLLAPFSRDPARRPPAEEECDPEEQEVR